MVAASHVDGYPVPRRIYLVLPLSKLSIGRSRIFIEFSFCHQLCRRLLAVCVADDAAQARRKLKDMVGAARPRSMWR